MKIVIHRATVDTTEKKNIANMYHNNSQTYLTLI